MIDRYSSKEMKEIFNDNNKFRRFLDVEIANCKAYNKLGLIRDDELELIEKNSNFTVEEITELEKVTKHDVIAFTRCVSKYLGEEKKWIHYSLTSTDVVDSAQALILKDANEIIEKRLSEFIEVLKRRSLEFKHTPIMGRTHGMHAEVTSFGLKWLLWLDEAYRCQEHFREARKLVEVIKISGAVGNFCDVDQKVEKMIGEFLGLDYAKISTQVLSRDRHSFYIYAIAQIASLIEKIAFEIRNLSRSEVREVEEYFDKGQKGSSAMPHKRNPIASENMCGCARMIKSYVTASFENNALWHERDISHSSCERIMLQDAATLIEYMLKRYTNVLNKLTVFEEQMLKNINLTKGLVFSSRVLNEMIKKGLSREESYDLIQPISFKSLETGIDFMNLLIESDVKNILTVEEIKKCFELEYYFKNVDEIYKRVIK